VRAPHRVFSPHDRNAPMLSKKYFWGGGRDFSAPLALPTQAEVRDRIDP
jgi:hypothetical protein